MRCQKVPARSAMIEGSGRQAATASRLSIEEEREVKSRDSRVLAREARGKEGPSKKSREPEGYGSSRLLRVALWCRLLQRAEFTLHRKHACRQCHDEAARQRQHMWVQWCCYAGTVQ